MEKDLDWADGLKWWRWGITILGTIDFCCGVLVDQLVKNPSFSAHFC